MKLFFKIFLLSLGIATILISMDKPTDSKDQEAAFKQLTNNNVCLLKNLVAKEQRGSYCPELYKAIQVIQKVSHSGSTNFFNKIENLEAISFLNDISQKSAGYNKLISLLNDENLYIGNTLLKLRKLLTKNRYIANTYGSCEPYQDRVITPLHYVLAQVNQDLWPQLKSLEYCKLLLSCGANPNAKDDAGNTPMHQASHPQFIELLYLYGTKPNAKGERGRTALLNNIRLRHWSVANCLLEYGANPNKKDNKGKSPLYQAIKQKSDPQYIQLLLDNGADCRNCRYGMMNMADEAAFKIIEKHVLSKLTSPDTGKMGYELGGYLEFYETEMAH